MLNKVVLWANRQFAAVYLNKPSAMHKKIPFIAASLFFAPALPAQVQKGSIYPGITAGQFVFRFNNSTLQPSVEVGVSSHSTLGLFYYSTRYNANALSNAGGNSTKRGGGISFTYHRYFNLHSKWGWYVNSTLGLYKIRVIEKQGANSYLNNRYGQGELTLTPGVFFTPSSKLMLFANIGGFSLSNNRYEFLRPGSSFVNQLSVGVRFTFGKNKKQAGGSRFNK